jgi:protein-tyrosine kinase
MDPATREQYSKLASALHQAQTERALKVVMVTSTLPQEGKTLTTINLALTLSESYSRQVLLIDADLRAPSLHEAFCLNPEPGLQDGLLDDWRRVLQRVHPHLVLLPAGRASNDPMGVLTLGAMQQMLDEARKGFDWILLDTPPMGLLPDANFLAGLVDSVIVVVRAGKTHYDLVQRAVGEMGLERIFGIVLNQAETAPAASGPYYAAYKKPPSES